jgi:hypothetical protein
MTDNPTEHCRTSSAVVTVARELVPKREEKKFGGC